MKTKNEVEMHNNKLPDYFLNAISNGILLLGEDLRIKRVNESFSKLVGKDSSELINLTLDDFILEDFEESSSGQVFEKEGQGEEEREILLKTSDGMIPAICTFTSLNSDNDEKFLVNIKDLSFIKKMEENFGSFAKLNPNPVIRIDEDGKIIIANNAFKKIFSYITVEEFVWPEVNKATNWKLLQTIFGSKGRYREEFKVDNKTFLIEYRGVNDHPYIHMYFFDITDLKKIEEEKSKMQNSLIQSAYSEGLAESAISVLHNIGNVLTSIMGHSTYAKDEAGVKRLTKFLSLFAGLLDKLDTDEKREDFFASGKFTQMKDFLQELVEYFDSFTQKLSEDMSSINIKCQNIGDIITTQQQYANLKSRVRSKLRLEDVLNDTLLIHRDKIEKRNVTLILNFQPSEIFIEKIGLSQTLSNAIVNAVESMDERFKLDDTYSTPTLEIKGQVEDGMYALEISDNAMGIEKQVLENIFNFGFSTKDRGSGFGLHSCANFLSSNGGEILITSDGKFRGAKTRINLPLAS